MANASTCMPARLSPSTSTPTRAAEIGSITVNMPLCAAGRCLEPVIHNQTVPTLAASA